MNLKEFVKETIIEIITGVKEAQNELGNDCVNPAPHMTTDFGLMQKQGMYNSVTGGIARNVEFDVAVTAVEGTETKGGIGIFVAGFGVGSQGQTDKSNTSLSRIQFSIPISLPYGKMKSKE